MPVNIQKIITKENYNKLTPVEQKQFADYIKITYKKIPPNVTLALCVETFKGNLKEILNFLNKNENINTNTEIVTLGSSNLKQFLFATLYLTLYGSFTVLVLILFCFYNK